MYGLYPQVAMGLYMGLYHGHANNTAAIRFAPARRQCSQLKKKRAGKYRVIYWTETQSHTPTQFSILRKSFSQQNSTRHEENLQRTFGKSVLLSLSNRIDFEILS